jgi:hypothetical protein
MGTVRATRNVISKVVRKRNRNRATAVAARNAISPEYRPNSCCPNTRRKESSDGGREESGRAWSELHGVDLRASLQHMQ